MILENGKKEKDLFNYHICENLLDALKFIRGPKNDFNFPIKKYINYKSDKIINSVIPFYSDDIKTKSNIFICVTKSGYIIIFSFYFFPNSLFLENEEKNIGNEIFNVIKSQNLEETSPLKIMRLEKCFNHKDYPNIFLVSFPTSGLQGNGCVKIVGILDDFSTIYIIIHLIIIKDY